MPIDAATKLELGFAVANDLGVPAHEPGRKSWDQIVHEIDLEMAAKSARSSSAQEFRDGLDANARDVGFRAPAGVAPEGLKWPEPPFCDGRAVRRRPGAGGLRISTPTSALSKRSLTIWSVGSFETAGRATSYPTSMDWTAVGSIGTFLAFLVAFVAIVKDSRERAETGRRSQAEHVSVWIDTTSHGCESPRGLNAIVLNGSGRPVYGGVVWLVRLQGGGGPATGEQMARWVQVQPEDDAWQRYGADMLAVIPPGMSAACLPDWEGGMHAAPGVEIAFTDSAGRNWIRRAEGRLEKISKEAAIHYGIGLPQSWRNPTRISR